MKNKISDEKLDQILEKLVKNSALDDEKVDEIAGSPQLWRNVQRQISEQKSSRKWFWIRTWEWRVAIFASLAFIFCAALVLLFNSPKENLNARQDLNKTPVAETKPIDEKSEISEPRNDSKISEKEIAPKSAPAKNVLPKRETKSNLFAKSQKIKATPKKNPQLTTKTEEIKTDFIALAYAPIPESGQILKVKVPRAMMVSLGVSTKVEKNSELVNAEVIVGDDGSARAIRFVQN